ncbi:HNH endonuclease [compost metagenome]
MASWRDDVVEALQRIGGRGSLAEIYESVKLVREANRPPTWQAIVRRELEYNSSDSKSHQKRHDLFRSVYGIGGGVWSLRDIVPDVVSPPDTVQVVINRIIRDTRMVRRLKAMYQDTCQICALRITSDDGRTYSEGHHVRPLGREHNGTDTEDNILILCPNCHAMCDLGFFCLNDEDIKWVKDHRVSRANLAYHNEHLAQ